MSSHALSLSLSSSTIAVVDHFLLIGSWTVTRWLGLNFAYSLGSVHFLSALFAASSCACMSISAFSAYAGSKGRSCFIITLLMYFSLI